jgi:hypothetical protein
VYVPRHFCSYDLRPTCQQKRQAVHTVASELPWGVIALIVHLARAELIDPVFIRAQINELEPEPRADDWLNGPSDSDSDDWCVPCRLF